MAVLISKATGNLTAAATWALVDPTSLLDAIESASFEIATAAAWSSGQAFVPGAIEIDGIAVKLAARLLSPTGTVSVRLYDVTGAGAVAGTTVTLNATDLPYALSTAAYRQGGWIFFAFVAPVTLAAGGNQYRVEAQESVGGDNIYLWRDATANNMYRMLRTTTAQAPVATDVMHVMGEHTGAGAGNNFTVTMDSVANTDYGAGTDDVAALTVSKRGTLSYGFAAATNYYLKLSGDLIVYSAGTLNIGTVANPIPRTGTAILEFDPTTDGGMGLSIRYGGTLVVQGLSRTAGKDVMSCLLNTDEAAGQTTLGVDTDTGWLAGDEVAIASTTRTYTQGEGRVLDGNAGANSFDITVGLTNAHSGTSPTQAEVILLTHYIKFRSATSTLMSYMDLRGGAQVDIDWMEVKYCGYAAGYQRGISISGNSASNVDIKYVSIHEAENTGLYASGLVDDNTKAWYINLWRCALSGGYGQVIWDGIGILDHVIMFTNYSSYSSARGLYTFGNGTFTNITIAGARSNGLAKYSGWNIGEMTNITIHSVNSYGLYGSTSMEDSLITNLKIWRCYSYGIFLNHVWKDTIFDTVELFGNNTYNIYLASDQASLTFKSLVSSGDSTFGTTTGCYFGADRVFADIKFIDSTFGVVAGIKTAHTRDFQLNTAYGYYDVKLMNTLLASATEIQSLQYMTTGSPGFQSQKHDQVAGAHKTWRRYGIIEIDAAFSHTAVPSERITPNSASVRIESGKKMAAVANGNSITFSAWVRKSSVAQGGADYNGNQPRLVVKANSAAGIAADVVLDTMTAVVDTWEQLTGATANVTDDAVLVCVVDCDGTTGFINTDDWAAA